VEELVELMRGINKPFRSSESFDQFPLATGELCSSTNGAYAPMLWSGIYT